MVYQSYKKIRRKVSPRVTVKKLSQSSYKNIRDIVSSGTTSQKRAASLRTKPKELINDSITDKTPEASLPIKNDLGVKTSFFSKVGNAIRNWSEDVDYRFRGYLPGALTPTAAKTRRAEEKLAENKLYKEAKTDLDTFDNEADLEKLKQKIEFEGEEEALKNELDAKHKSWWEFFNKGESALSAERDRLARAKEEYFINQQQADLREQEHLFNSQLQERGFTDEEIKNITKPQENKTFFDNLFPTTTSKISSTLLLVGVGVLGYFLLKRK